MYQGPCWPKFYVRNIALLYEWQYFCVRDTISTQRRIFRSGQNLTQIASSALCGKMLRGMRELRAAIQISQILVKWNQAGVYPCPEHTIRKLKTPDLENF